MGTRKLLQASYAGARDHPHAYGDKVAPETVGQYIGGSSPRVWGQVAF